jgi:uncharacterized protein
MLRMRPNCECCDRNLPAPDEGAWICSFECTFCAVCAEGILEHRCPNCAGELVRRPPRAAALLERYPAQRERVTRSTGCEHAT